MRLLIRTHGILLLLAVLGLPRLSLATVVNWNVSTGGTWTNSANWNPVQVPGANDQAVIGSAIATGNTVTLDGDQTVYGFQTGPGSGKTVTLASGSPSTSKLIILSTDTSTNGSTTFFALSGNNGTNNVNTPIQLGTGSTGSFTATFNSFVNASNFVINGAITESPGQAWGVRIVGNGSGIVNYGSAAKTYSGDTTIATNGILKLNASDMIPDGVGKGNVVIEGSGQFQLNNVNETINGLSSTSTTASVSKTGSNTRTLTVGGGNANASYAGTVSFTGGTSTISKLGTGAQTFSGSVSAPGTASVNGGTLLVNSSSWGPAITIASGGTLAGTGTIAGAVTVQGGGTLAPGNNVGALSTGSSIESIDTGALTFNNTSTFAYELASTAGTPAADLVNANGALNITAGAMANVSDIAASPSILPAGTKFTLISYAGAWNNSSFTGKPDDSTIAIGVNQFVIDYNGTSAGSVNGGLYANAVTLTSLAAIPEAPAPLFVVVAVCVVAVGYTYRRSTCRAM